MYRSVIRRTSMLGAAVALVLPLALLNAQEPGTADDQLVAAGTPAPAVAAAERSELWFVELASPPTADGSSLAQVRGEKTTFRRAAAQARIAYQERRAFDTLWNGLSIRIAPSDVARVARLDGVKAVYPVSTVRIPETDATSSPELFSALTMTGADVAQSTLGLTGAGVKVAVMDTGIDYDNPDLGGCFGPGCRVATGYDFVGDNYDANFSTPAYAPVPDSDPDDCNGHGTHVAGIIGANGNLAAGGVKGVAPGVTFGAYRVFGCEGSTSDDIMLAAMERALADGMQVLNMSIGASFQWPQYPTAQASDRLVNKGVVVVASAGNSGANGLYSASAPAVASKVIAVASFDNIKQYLPYFTISPDGMHIGYTDATAAAPTPSSGSYPMARTGTATSTADACSALPAGSLTGRVALIRRGTCGFFVKALNAQNAGAAGVVLYNNVAGRISPTVAGTTPITIPVVSVSDTEGVLINNRIAAGLVTMTWTGQKDFFSNPLTGGRISSFSSYGLSPDLTLKPDIGAPGGFIYSTWPLEKGGHASLSGTSMASPHVAGAVALLLQARPHTPPALVRTLLQNSAHPAPFSTTPFLDVVHRQGAGMLNIADAVLATTKVEPSKLSLGESETGPATRTLTITNESSAPVTYSLGHTAALASNVATFAPGLFTTAATVSFTDSASAPITSITVPAGGSAQVNATIAISAPATNADRRLYGGYIVVTDGVSGAVSRVPYAGFRGDYQSVVSMPATNVPPTATQPALTLPALAKFDGTNFFPQTAGASFSMTSGDVPVFVVHLDQAVRYLRIEIRDALTGESWHRAADASYLGRNSSSVSFFGFDWDGTTVAGKKAYTVPNGQYVAVVTVLKALGDESNPAHIETWTSPLFQIARPTSSTN